MGFQQLARIAVLGGVVVLLGGARLASAQSADALVDVLVNKGVLTLEEGKQLRRQADQDFTRAYAAKTGLPSWVTALKVGGDFSGRYAGIFSGNSDSIERERYRYRLRFGVTALMLDHFEVGFRLGSGDFDNLNDWTGADPTSLNQTFQNNASKKGIFLDLAYGTWHALNSAAVRADLTVGKMLNPFVFSQMVLDSDYTPEGAAAQFTFRLNRDAARAQALKLNLGAFVLDENAQGDDPSLLAAQLRWEGKFSQARQPAGFDASAGIAFLSIQNVGALINTAVPNINRGNTRTPAGVLTSSFNPVVANGALGYTLAHFPLYPAPFPITLSGEFLFNPEVQGRNQGYDLALIFGKAGKRGRWQASYIYRYLEANAWYEELVDSYFGGFYAAAPVGSGGGRGYATGTNVRGHIAQLQYSPTDSLVLGAAALLTELIDPPAVPNNRSDALRLQADATWKF